MAKLKYPDVALFHTADLHIGACRNVYEYMTRAQDVCSGILSYIAEYKAKHKILVIAGDLGDGKKPSEHERNLMLEFVTSALESKIHVVMINGNHDFYDESGVVMLEMFQYIKRVVRKHLHVVTHKPQCVDIQLDDSGISFLCVPCQQDLSTKQLNKILANLRKDAKYSLQYGVVHEALSGALTGNDHRMKTSCDVPDIGDIRGIMLGDIHLRQSMGPRAWYCGSPYQIKYNEPKDKGFLVWHPQHDEPDYVPLSNVAKLIEITDPKKLKKYENTKHSVRYVGTERIECDAVNVTSLPNLKAVAAESLQAEATVEESRHSALIGLREHLKADGLSEDEIALGYKLAELEINR